MSSSSTTSDPSALPVEPDADHLAEQVATPLAVQPDEAASGVDAPAGETHEPVVSSEALDDDDVAAMSTSSSLDTSSSAVASIDDDTTTTDRGDESMEAMAVPPVEMSGEDGQSADGSATPSGPSAAAPAAPAVPDMNPAACAQELRKRFPALFAGAVKPLKLRIQQDIQERAPGIFSKTTLTGFFRRHTRSTPYLMALSKATHRIDLDGQQAGELSEEHRVAATEELTRRRANQDARRAEEQAQHQAAHAAEQARRAETEVAQRQRASLLRDFQATTLTLANFCALKGLAPEALEPMLAQARLEAEERAKNPPPMQRPHVDGRTNPRNDGRESRGDGRRDGRGGPREGASSGGPAGSGGAGGPRRGGNAGSPGGPRNHADAGGPGGPRNGGNAGGPNGPRDGGHPGGSGGPRNAGGPRNGPPGGRSGERGPRNAGGPQGGHRNGLVAPKPSGLAADARDGGKPRGGAANAEVPTARPTVAAPADARPVSVGEAPTVPDTRVENAD